jgi:hypothetical protein
MAIDDPSDSKPGASAAVSTGIERALLRARDEPSFLAELQQRRSEAAREAGIGLSSTEAALLDSVEPSAIAQMVDNLPAGAPALRDATPAGPCQGIRPDLPGSIRGIQADTPGQAAFDPVRGSRTGVKVAVATGVVLAAGAGALLCATAGARTDVPPPAAGPAPEPEDASNDGVDPDPE